MGFHPEGHGVIVAFLPGQRIAQKITLCFRFPAACGTKGQADGLLLIALGDDAHQDILPPESGNGKHVPMGIEELHAALRQGRVLLFQMGKPMVEPILLTILEGLAPGHGVAAAFHGIQCAVNFRFVTVVDRGRTGEQELENHRAPVAFRRNLGIVVQAAGIVTVEEVKLILPHIPDKKYAFALALNYYKILLKAGVEIYEYTPGFVHAKTFISDDKKAVVGTFNLDYRSLYHHFECATYMYQVSAIDAIKKDIETTLEKCQKMNFTNYKKGRLGLILMGKVLKFLEPLM